MTAPADEQTSQLSLSTAAARNLATTTKSVPQMQGISPRWLLRALPWEEVSAGTFRVNRRHTYTLGDGRVSFTNVGADIRVVPQELRELPLLRGFDDEDTLGALAERFEQREFEPGQVIVEFGNLADRVHVIAHGKASKIGTRKYSDPTVLGVLTDGDFFGAQVLAQSDGIWEFTVKTLTPCIVVSLQEHVPIILGGGGERRTLRLAARYADAANVMGDLDTVRHKGSVLRRHCAEFDREVAMTHLCTTLVGDDDRHVAELVERLRPPRQDAARYSASVNASTVTDHIGRFRELAEAGVAEVMIRLPDLTDAEPLARLAKVIAAFR